MVELLISWVVCSCVSRLPWVKARSVHGFYSAGLHCMAACGSNQRLAMQLPHWMHCTCSCRLPT